MLCMLDKKFCRQYFEIIVFWISPQGDKGGMMFKKVQTFPKSILKVHTATWWWVKKTHRRTIKGVELSWVYTFPQACLFAYIGFIWYKLKFKIRMTPRQPDPNKFIRCQADFITIFQRKQGLTFHMNQMIHIKCQALFSLKNNLKKTECHLLLLCLML